MEALEQCLEGFMRMGRGESGWGAHRVTKKPHMPMSMVFLARAVWMACEVMLRMGGGLVPTIFTISGVTDVLSSPCVCGFWTAWRRT